MCELNYRGTKIKIGVKLRDQKCNFTYKKWSFYKESLKRWHVALTRGSQRLMLTVIRSTSKSGFQDQFCKIYKTGGPNFWIKL